MPTDNLIKRNVSNNFGKAQHSYDSYGSVQNKTAQELLACVVKRMGSKKIQKILEIGCGTGFLSKHILNHFKESQFFVTDIAQPLVQQCHASLSNITAIVCDGESLPLERSFKLDLIIANMAFQWFFDFELSIDRLFNQTKMLAFSIPIEGSFETWCNAHQLLAIQNRMLKFYSYTQLEAILKALKPKRLSINVIDISYEVASAIELLKYLKKLGANTNLNGDRYKIFELRSLCKLIDASKGKDLANYKIAICVLER